MRYFQGAPLQVLDLADGWAHVRMGMTGESLEGYIRQERLKYGAEAMREVQQYAEMPGFDEDTPVYEACDEQSGVIDTLAAPGGVKLMGYNGRWAAVWGENGFIPMTGTIRPGRWTSSWMVLPLAGELTKEEALRKLREWVPQKREEWNISEVYTDALLLGLTAAGLVLLPVLSVVQGFFLSFSVGCFARALGRGGVYLALAAFGPRCLFVLPCTLLLTVQGLSAAAHRRSGQRTGLPDAAYWRRAGLCCLILLLGTALELTLAPRLLQWVIARVL